MGCAQQKTGSSNKQSKTNEKNTNFPTVGESQYNSKIDQKNSNVQYLPKTSQEVTFKQYDPNCKERQYNVMVNDILFSVINPPETGIDIIGENQGPMLDHVIEN